ncbi:MAG: methylated-DNA-protein-cysteine methyltransferase-like protein [Candidatus Poriferisodalaceae bacterium]
MQNDDIEAGLTKFETAIAKVLVSLAPGDVMTYGEVCEEADYPRRARAVGRFLATKEGYPWWRVVNSVGRLAPNNVDSQTALLRGEGVDVVDGHVVGMRRRRADRS